MIHSDRRLLERLPLVQDRQWLGYLLAILLSLFAGWLRWVLNAAFPPGFPYLTFFPAVILSSFLFGRGPGTLAAVLCGLIAWYYFIPPFNSFVLLPTTAVAIAFYAAVVAVDVALVHLMQQANERLRDERERSRALADRTELLFHELQHRVSNNLQMAGAVLALQKRAVADPDAHRAIEQAATKLQLIGRIQRQLYGTRGEQAEVGLFLRQLIDDLAVAGSKPGVTCTIDAQAGLRLDPDILIPVTLIVAEAIANAIEHGFADRNDGHIEVAIRHSEDEEQLLLTVVDDGAGLPAGFDLGGTTSLGLRIARTLALQIGGRLALTPAERGAVTSLTLPFRNALPGSR